MRFVNSVQVSGVKSTACFLEAVVVCWVLEIDLCFNIDDLVSGIEGFVSFVK